MTCLLSERCPPSSRTHAPLREVAENFERGRNRLSQPRRCLAPLRRRREHQTASSVVRNSCLWSCEGKGRHIERDSSSTLRLAPGCLNRQLVAEHLVTDLAASDSVCTETLIEQPPSAPSADPQRRSEPVRWDVQHVPGSNRTSTAFDAALS